MKNILSKALLIALIGSSVYAMEEQKENDVFAQMSVNRTVQELINNVYLSDIKIVLNAIKEPLADMFDINMIMIENRKANQSTESSAYRIDQSHKLLLDNKRMIQGQFKKISQSMLSKLHSIESNSILVRITKDIVISFILRLNAAIEPYDDLNEIAQAYDVFFDKVIKSSGKKLIELVEECEETAKELYQLNDQVAQLVEKEKIIINKKCDKNFIAHYAELTDDQLDLVNRIVKEQRDKNDKHMENIQQEEQDQQAIQYMIEDLVQYAQQADNMRTEQLKNNHRALMRELTQAAKQKRIKIQAALKVKKEQELQREKDQVIAQQKAAAQVASEKEKVLKNPQQQEDKELQKFLDDSLALLQGELSIDNNNINKRINLIEKSYKKIPTFASMDQTIIQNVTHRLREDYNDMVNKMKKSARLKKLKKETAYQKNELELSEIFERVTDITSQVLNTIHSHALGCLHEQSVVASSTTVSQSNDGISQEKKVADEFHAMSSAHVSSISDAHTYFLALIKQTAELIDRLKTKPSMELIEQCHAFSLKALHDKHIITDVFKDSLNQTIKQATQKKDEVVSFLNNNQPTPQTIAHISTLLPRLAKEYIALIYKIHQHAQIVLASNQVSSHSSTQQVNTPQENVHVMDNETDANGIKTLKNILQESRDFSNDGAAPSILADRTLKLAQRLMSLLTNDYKNELIKLMEPAQIAYEQYNQAHAASKIQQNNNIKELAMQVMMCTIPMVNLTISLNATIEKLADRALRKITHPRLEQKNELKKIMMNILKYNNKCTDISSLKNLVQECEHLLPYLQGRSKEWFKTKILNYVENNKKTFDENNSKEIKDQAQGYIDITNALLRLIYKGIEDGASDEQVAESIARRIDSIFMQA